MNLGQFPMKRLSRSFSVALLVLLFGVSAIGQDSSGQSSDKERITAERYMSVLLRRPRPGVALDRVYGYHVQNDSLPELEKQLTAEGDQAGSRQMVWGLIQLQRGKSSEAVRLLKDAEAQLPDEAACPYYLGRAYLGVGQTEQAAAAMERAIEHGPARTEALPIFTELGRIYSRAGQTEKSLGVWTRLEKLFPGDSRVGGQIAQALAEEGNYEQAKLRYEALAKSTRKPDEKIAFSVQAAEMQRRLGASDEATAALEKILARLRPGSWLHTDVRNRIEASFLKSGDYDGLAEYYQEQLKQKPDALDIQTRLSRIMITAGRLSDAQDLLQSAVERAPDDIEARLTLIDVLVAQGKIADVVKQFEQLEKIDPGNPDHLIRWGQVVLDGSEKEIQERRDAAATVWMRLAENQSDNAVLLSQVADQMRSIERNDDAIKLYRQAIEQDPTSPQYREYLGEFLFTLDRKDEAIEVWKSIAEGDRHDRQIVILLCGWLKCLGHSNKPTWHCKLGRMRQSLT